MALEGEGVNSTNTGLGSTIPAPRGGYIEDKARELRAGRSAGQQAKWACENQRRGKVGY